MKYYKLNNEVYAFEADGSQDDYITEDMVKMSDGEVDRHVNPEKYLSDEERLQQKRSQYPKLTRYQFMRGMLEYGYKSSDIEAQIMLIEDEYTRELTMLGFKDAGYFERNDQSVTVMRDILEKTDLEIDEFWELCATF